MLNNPTVFIVDDDPAVCHSLTRLLESANYTSESYESAVKFLEEGNPSKHGCLLLDIKMPEINGLELQAILNDRDISLPVIVITGHADVPMAVAAMKNGAHDFIEKPFDDEAILACISRAITDDASSRQKSQVEQRKVAKLASLSPREHEVLDGLVGGRTVDQIARTLKISPKTVYMHRTHLMDKLECDSVASLVKMKLQTDVPNV